LAAFAAPPLAAAFFATFVDLMDVLLANAFTRGCYAMRLVSSAWLLMVPGDVGPSLPSPAPGLQGISATRTSPC